MRKVFTFLGCLTLVGLLHCGGADIGDSCKHEGQTSGCTDGAVCAANKSGSLVCEKLCSSVSDCSTTQECEDVPYSELKGCFDLGD